VIEVDQVESDKANRKLQNVLKKNRLAREHEERLKDLFRYYASTDIPVERVAVHMGLELKPTVDGLIWAGRKFG
jgi:hypothetical protein